MTDVDRTDRASGSAQAAAPWRSGRPAQKQEPELPRHVIDAYTHKSQTVRCECGWVGSSASPDGKPSAWRRHVAEFKV